MESGNDNNKIVVIVGETASGKSALAEKVAKKFNGEIVSADSRTLYIGMDIGTDKPSLKARSMITHHLIDIRNPNKTITVSEYKVLADKAIERILKSGKLPILVGGSGLYVDSVIYNFEFNNQPQPELRKKLESLTLDELNLELELRNIDPPENIKNRRHIIRKIETEGRQVRNNIIRDNTLIIGLRVDPEELTERIKDRVKAMLVNGLESEVDTLVSMYGKTGALTQTIGYKEFLTNDSNERDLNNITGEIISNTKKYSKRQKTWFKRNKNIQWVDKQIEAVDLVTTFLNK
jgi:tRNA dimethylallyltransferase